MKRVHLHGFLSLSLAGALALAVGCGGGGGSSNSGGGGGGTGSGSPTSNVQAITVNTGPTAGPPYNDPYVAFLAARQIVRRLAASWSIPGLQDSGFCPRP